MADAKISQLPVATTPLAGTELVPVVQGGVTDQTTVEAILTGTVPSGTANGVLYLNGSKVVTSGSALTFDGTSLGIGATPTSYTSSADNLVLYTASGNSGMTLATNGAYQNQICFADGTTGVEPYVGRLVYDHSGNTMRFDVAAVEQMRLTSTGLGIGTNNPVGKAQVNGVFLVGGQTATRSTPQIGIGNAQIESSSFAALQIFGNANTTDGSYILLGKTRAGATGGITIVQQNDVLGGLFFTGSDGVNFRSGASIYAEVDGAPAAGSMPGRLVFATTPAGSTSLSIRMRIDSAGNLGLGVTPSAWSGLAPALQVQRASIITSSASAVDTYFSSNAFYDGNWKYILSGPATQYVQNASGDHRWRVAASGTAGNAISFTQAMTLDASGNLGVGVTNPAAKLEVYGGASGTVTNIQVGNASTAFQVGVDSSNNGQIRTAQNVSMLFYTNATERARIPAAGGMVVGTAALATTATDGFLYVPTCAGTPTGTPTTQTGTAPIVVDTTNNKLYFYSGGQWRDAGP